MNQSEIKRVKVITTVENEVDLPDVRKEAAEILGYKKPKVEDVLPDEIALALGKLQIEHFDWRDVLRYQFEAREKMNREKLTRFLGSDAIPDEWGKRSCEWARTKIADFHGYVPDHALQKAIEIQKELPGAILYVEHLEDDRDPFLVVATKVRYSELSYYIEVWDEPGFERQ